MTAPRLLLASSSRVHGSGYLDHLETALGELLAGASRLLFVPYALADQAGYAARARERFAAMGVEMDSIHEADSAAAAVERAEAVFVGGGNTFRLLDRLYRERLLAPLRERVAGGMPYSGASAGSNLAGPSIRTTNDMPIVYPPSFDALALVPFQINPHYIDPDPDSTHMGETRDTRLNEYHEENPLPVVALREGAMVRVEGRRMTLEGGPGGKLFRRGQPSVELAAGTRLDRILDTDSGS